MIKKKPLTLTRYPEFGRLYKLMVVRIVYNDQRALLSWGDDSKIKQYLHKNTKFITANGYDFWRKGDIIGDQPLSLQNLEGFILENLGKRGASSYAFLDKLIKSGPSRYFPILEHPKIEELKEKEFSLIKGNRYNAISEMIPVPFCVPHPDKTIIDRKLFHDVAKLRKTPFRAVLTGCQGSGKSTLMQVLAYTEFLTTYDQIIWLDARDLNLPPSLTMVQTDFLPVNETTIGMPAKMQLDRLLQLIKRQKVILMVDNCNTRDSYEMIINSLPPEFDAIFEIQRPELAFEVDPLGEATYQVDGFTQDEADVYWKYVASKVENMNRDIFDSLCVQTRNIPEQLFFALGRVRSLPPDWFLKEHVIGPYRSILERIYESLEVRQRIRLAQMGALPHLRSYKINVFMALWKCDEREVQYELKQFADFNLVDELPDGSGWKISRSVLKYAAELLPVIWKHNKEQAQSWMDRIDVEALSKKLVPKYHVGSLQYLRLRRQKPKYYDHFFVRFWRQLLNPYDDNDYWNLFKGLTQWMHSDEYLVAYYAYQRGVKAFENIPVLFVVAAVVGFLNGLIRGGVSSEFVTRLISIPVVALVVAVAFIITPRLRMDETICLQIWRAIQERRGDGE